MKSKKNVNKLQEKPDINPSANRETELQQWVESVSKGALERDIRPFPVRYFRRVVTNLVNACWGASIPDAENCEKLILAGLEDAENAYLDLQLRLLAEVRKMHFPGVAAAQEWDIAASALW